MRVSHVVEILNGLLMVFHLASPPRPAPPRIVKPPPVDLFAIEAIVGAHPEEWNLSGPDQAKKGRLVDMKITTDLLRCHDWWRIAVLVVGHLARL
jgi:hypothetical protein